MTTLNMGETITIAENLSASGQNSKPEACGLIPTGGKDSRTFECSRSDSMIDACTPLIRVKCPPDCQAKHLKI